MSCGGVFGIDRTMQQLEMRIGALERSAWRLPSVDWQTVFIPTVVGTGAFLGVKISNRISKGDQQRDNYPIDSIVGGAIGTVFGVMVGYLFTESSVTGRLGMVTMLTGGLYAHFRW